MKRTLRRVVVVVAVALVGTGAGSGLFASPALAGGYDSAGVLHSTVWNLTPYTWTLVAEGAPDVDGLCGRSCWNYGPATTLAPGQGHELELEPYASGRDCIDTSFHAYYTGWYTYRIDVLGGPPEYQTVAFSGQHSDGCNGDNGVLVEAWNTVAPPPPDYANVGLNKYPAPAAVTANPQLLQQFNVPSSEDLTYQIAGNYTVDASTNLGQPFVDVLNALCVDNANTSCSFTQQGPLTWGIGTPVKQLSATNCVVGAGARPPRGSPARVVGDLAPNYTEMSFTEAQSASLSVGGGVTASTEFNLFDTISGKISVSIEAQHEWQKTATYTRQYYVYIPSNDIASVWVAPTVGNVTGTLVVSNGSATFTATNFTEVRSGASKDALTPAFNAITKIRPMTTSEYDQFCKNSSAATGLGATNGLMAVRPPVRLVAGLGVARVALGQTRAAVARLLGRPRLTLFSDQKCRGLDPGCDAVPAAGGISVYRQMSVLFGGDSRVSGLIYLGPVLSARGVGVGSVVTAVRSAYPGTVCTGYARQRYCTVRGVFAGRAVKTVFRFTKLPGGRYACDRVLIYLVDPRSGQVGA
ncbi:MAG: hypothetical protein JO168_25350 [Solirubrobacterales bacterium]|nr:hypothetical protein [Solirubrobacterales bacterium]